MPVKVRKKLASESGKAYKIVEASTGEVSATKSAAEASARVRNRLKRKR